MFKKSTKKTGGWTIVELVMTITIIAILFAVVAPVIAISADLINLHITREPLRQEALRTLTRMQRDIRRIADNQSISTANSTDLVFVNIDGNTIEYIYEDVQSGPAVNMQVRRRVNGSSTSLRTLSDAISNFTLTYYDRDGNTIATPTVGIGTTTNIIRIQIDLELTDGNETVYMRSAVSPRNFTYLKELLE